MKLDHLGVQLTLLKGACHNPVLNLLSPLEQEIARVVRQIEQAENAEDADWYTEGQCERIEELLGLVFVCAQVFITGVRTKFEALVNEDSTDRNKIYALQSGLKLSGFDFTVAEAINVVANYWKHQEEWPVRLADRGDCRVVLWNKDKMEKHPKHTAEVSEKLGMEPSSSANLRTAAKALGATEKFKLSVIKTSVLDWAENLYKRAQRHVETIRGIETQSPRHDKF
jgi:hypothetical protein